MAAGVLVVIALTGCSTMMWSVVGLRVDDDRLVATVLTCDNVTSDQRELSRVGGQFFLIPRPTWGFEATDHAEIDLGTVDSFIADIDPVDRMMISDRASQGAGGFVHFWVDDVTSLKEDEVLAFDQELGEMAVMDEAGLREQREYLCALVSWTDVLP